MHEVVYVSWYLSDRWGSREEGGCSLHLSLDDFDSWNQSYRKKTEINGHMPDCYFMPYKGHKTVSVDENLYQKIRSSELGLRCDEEEELELLKNGVILIC